MVQASINVVASTGMLINMYDWEMSEYINNRNGQLNREETKYIIDINLHPQLNHITYNVYDSSYDMWDCNGNYYHFCVVGE